MLVEEAASVVKGIEAVWGEMSTEGAVAFIECIGDLPFAPTKDAVRRLMNTRATRPTPAVVRAAVADGLGLCAPAVDVAVEQARLLADYSEQVAFANGSGWLPSRPEVHPAVARAFMAVGDHSHPSWLVQFRAVYTDMAESARTETVAGLMGSEVPGLPSAA